MMNSNNPFHTIPMLDLVRQYDAIHEEIDAAVKEVLVSGKYINGPQVAALEKKMAGYLGIKQAIGVASGSDALLLSLQALGIGPNDKVAVPAFTFFATAGAVSRLGAIPVFIDIDPVDYTIDTSELEYLLERDREIKAVIPVHLFGKPCNINEIMRIAEFYQTAVIEDACQSVGAVMSYREQRIMAGTVGDMGCFSFFPSKNLGAYGDGGMVVTNDDEKADHIRMLSSHGARPKYKHRCIGMNSRLDTLQAAILLAKLYYLPEWTAKRIRVAGYYREGFIDMDLHEQIKLPPESEDHVYNQFVIECPRRDLLAANLARQGIASEIYYPLPLHLQECYRQLGYLPGSLPVSEKACDRVLALPIDPELTKEQVLFIVNHIASFLKADA